MNGKNLWRFNNYSRTLLLITIVWSNVCISAPAVVVGSPVNQRVASELAVPDLGIKIHGLVLSSAGYMLDLRYRVIDVEKAAPLMDRKVKPYLLVVATGARLEIPDTPKVGMLRQMPRNNDVVKKRDYFIMFANPGHRLHEGDKVDLFVGDTRIENLSIQ